MRRRAITPRSDWQARVESQGLHFHTLDQQPYWDESACYAFAADEIDLLEQATYAINDMCLKAVDHVLQEELWDAFQIPPPYRDWVRRSWDEEEYTIYGRLDFSYRPGAPPKLLEYNADTPTALLEAAVIQWFWLKDTGHGRDQFNSIHERLIEVWRVLKGKVAEPVIFASPRGNLEDFLTVTYLRDTAQQAGLATDYLTMADIGWHAGRRRFTDRRERPLGTVFKLYPWEWMVREQFGPHLVEAPTRWLEAPWKMILSNKAILPVLWRLFPDSPYLLRADDKPWSPTYIRKPLLAREGANVSLVVDGRTVLETEGTYGGPYVYQEWYTLPEFDGHSAVLGSWLVNGYACGLGVREDRHPVTQNTSRFVPHYIE